MGELTEEIQQFLDYHLEAIRDGVDGKLYDRVKKIQLTLIEVCYDQELTYWDEIHIEDGEETPIDDTDSL